MYALFLDGDYPNAQRAAELILARRPADALALAVLAEVRAAIAERAADLPFVEELGEDDLVEDTFVTPASLPAHAPVLTPPPRFDEITTVDALPVLPRLTGDTPEPADVRATVRPPHHDDDVLAISWGSAIDTVRVHEQSPARTSLYEAYLASDFRGALALADDLLAKKPDDAMALAIRSECLAAIELRSSIPVPAADADVATLDPRSAALLARVDGATTVEALAATADMPESDAIRLLETLLARGVLRIGEPRATL